MSFRDRGNANISTFRGVAHAAWGGAIEHENYSPPLEGCRGGLFRDGKDPPLKVEAFFPPPERGFSWELENYRHVDAEKSEIP